MPLTMRRRAYALTLALMMLLALMPSLARSEAAPTPATVDTYDPKAPQNLLDTDLVGKAALVMDSESGEVLFDKNARRKTYPASTTKIMTCLVALENSALTDMVTIPAAAEQIPLDSSKTGVKAGEVMTMGDLLNGMMIESGNDAAIAVAMHVSGSVQAFVDLMNQRARELGCRDTFFVNPHGYHDDAHVSTAYDLALIAREAMKRRDFREIVAAKSYTMASTAIREKKTFATKNPMFVASSKYYYPDLIGIKTGFHSKAGQCFVGAAVKDGVNLISVVLKSGKNEKWSDTARLFDYAITRYEALTFQQMFDRSPVYASVKNASLNDQNSGLVKLSVVPGSALDSYRVRCLPEHEAEALRKFSESLSVSYTSSLQAPIRTGDILGTLTMSLNGQNVTATVVASRDVELAAEPFSLKGMFPGLADALTSTPVLIGLGVLAVIIVLLIILRIRAAIRDHRRRREMLRRRRAAYDRYHKG